MIFTRSLDFLRAGEDDGGSGGGVTVLDPPAETVETPDQPTEETPASAPAPVEVPEETPAGEPAESPGEDLTSEERVALIEHLRNTPEYQEAIAKDAPKQAEPPRPERVKANDPFFAAIKQQSDDSYARIADSLRKLNEGELEDANDLMANIAVTGAFQAASERRGHIDVNRAILERELGMETLTEGDPIHDQYDAALTRLETVQQNAYRLRGQAVREYDPQKRAALITRAEVMDAEAVGEFYHRGVLLALEKGKVIGLADAEKSFTKRAPVIAEKARANGQTEAIAKARQTLAAGRAMATGSGAQAPASNGALTLDEAQTLSIDELIRRTKAQ